MVLLSSIIFQVFTNKVLCRFDLFLASNYNDLLISLFSAQVTIIILPLSLFGIFTEITNEVYLGQSLAEYMYMYKGNHLFAFSYKELTINSMLLTLAEYVFMSKELLTAELMILVLNTTAMLVSLFSWLEIRIKKEEFYTFIQEQLYTTISICTKQGLGNTYISKLLSKLKDWVVNGGNQELVEAMEFYENLNIRRVLWDTVDLNQNTEEKEPVKGLFSTYKIADSYFDELIADLLHKQDYYRALRCSKSMLETIAHYRVNNYYHPSHYHYYILLNLFQKMSEMEIALLGNSWFCDYIIIILKNGTANKYLAPDTQTEKLRDREELQCITEESYILAYEFLMSIWKNKNLPQEYKQKQLEDFLSTSISDLRVNYSALCVKMKLIETKEQEIIDMIVKKNWSPIEFSIGCSLLKEQDEECEFLIKSIILILSYTYYLAAYIDQNITIPQLKGHIVNTKIGFIDEYYSWEVLADYALKYLDEINEFLVKNHKLDKNFQQEYFNVICEILLYSAMVYKQWPIHVKNNIEAYSLVIHYFRHITGNNEFLAEKIRRYKIFIDLFGTRNKITEQMINDEFYKLKKMILQYYMEPLKKTVKEFDKNTFWENKKRKIWDEILADQRFKTNSFNAQISSKDLVIEAMFNYLYLILPYEGKFDANEIKEWLCGRILRKSTDIKKTCRQKQVRTYDTYDVLSLEWKEEPLDDEEIEYLIEKESGQGFIVRFDFYPKTSIFSMNFRTYEEAHEFVTLEYKKVVFRIKVKI